MIKSSRIWNVAVGIDRPKCELCKYLCWLHKDELKISVVALWSTTELQAKHSKIECGETIFPRSNPRLHVIVYCDEWENFRNEEFGKEYEGEQKKDPRSG